MGTNRGNGGNSGSGFGSATPGCCSRKIGGKPSGRGLGKPAPRAGGLGKPKTSSRPGLGAGRGFSRGGGIKR